MQWLKAMKLKEKSLFFLIVFLFSLFSLSSCSHSRKSLCSGNITPKASYNKRNKSNYGKRFSYKPRSVKKDYVIKNGIAH